MTPDINVLVPAFRDDHPQHVRARAWLTEAIEACSRGGTLEILPMVAAGFVRIVTNRRVFPSGPASPAQAVAFLRSMTRIPGVVMPPLGPEWGLFEKLCVDLELSGNDVSDAWIAAAVSAGGYHLVTFDADFARLLRPSEYTLLTARTGVRESRATYAVSNAQHRGGREFRPRRTVSPESVWKKLERSGLKESDVEHAVRWARRKRFARAIDDLGATPTA